LSNKDCLFIDSSFVFANNKRIPEGTTLTRLYELNQKLMLFTKIYYTQYSACQTGCWKRIYKNGVKKQSCQLAKVAYWYDEFLKECCGLRTGWMAIWGHLALKTAASLIMQLTKWNICKIR